MLITFVAICLWWNNRQMELKSTSILFSRIHRSDLYNEIFTTYTAISFTSNWMLAVSPRQICQEMNLS